MYNTEKNPGFNIKDVIIKAIFLVLFILLLVWLFPKVPNMKPFYSNVFRENIKYMQDAAESYYTTDKLPKNVGDTAEMTLQDMIDKNLILPFVDEDGNSCDTKKSYVEVKKNKNDYTLKVNLVCPNEENYIEKTLGCYQYCEDGNCQNSDKKNNEEKPLTAIEYQFKQTGSKDVNYYTCPDGGTLINGICNIYTTDTYKATVITTKGEEYCKDGGELKNGRCYKVETAKYKASVREGVYYCPDGGRLNGDTCYVDKSSSYDATEVLSCPNGGSLQGTKCIVEHTSSGSSYDASVRYTCPNGGSLSGTRCITKAGTSGSSYGASVRYTCPNGGSLSGTKCITKAGTSGSSYPATKTTSRVESRTPLSGSDLTSAGSDTVYICTSSSNCPGYVTIYYYIRTSYTCPNGGSLSGTTCKVSGTSEQSYGATPSYYCPNGGSLSGTTCRVSGTSEESYSATPNYYCPNGGSLSGTTCRISGSSSSSSYDASRTLTCPNGGKLQGSKCVIFGSYTYKATKSNGEKYCPNGGNLSGDYCVVTKTTDYKANVTDGKTTKTCPNGGNLKDDGLCYVNKLSKSYKATLNTRKQYYTNYKWSREESLPGWVRTGETRQVTIGSTSFNKQK